jgi:2-oxoglutarate dehydrogenase complex dehydrogenase (E1) component-like enzyme
MRSSSASKYVGTKRFGLDGGESMIPALEAIIKYGGALGVREIVYGMAHRGRLNVLANVMAKPFRVIFHEFSGGTPTRGCRRFGRREVSPRHRPTASSTASRCT